jgi:general secretion pathway protein I
MSSSIGSRVACRSASRAAEPDAAAGFTLIEVIVAFAVAGLLLVILSRALGLGVMGTARVKSADDAAILAESALDPLGVITPLKDGDTADLDRGAYHIHVTVDRYADSAAPRVPGYLTLYRISATVAWREMLRRRDLTLTTLRLGPQG